MLNSAIALGQLDTAPTLVTNTPLTTIEGGTTAVTGGWLDYDDAEQADTEIVYTISALASHGTLRLNGFALGLGGTFTQDDLNNERVTYRHDGSEGPSDSFGFSVSDGQSDPVTGQTFFR